MPYNPSSAYPRHSTYTPPVYNQGFARAINEPNLTGPIGRSAPLPMADVRHALQRGLTPGTSEHIGLTMQALGRPGIFSRLQQSADRAAQIAVGRKVWNRAEYGDDPNEVATSNVADRPSMNTAMASKGGRKHVAGINERLGAISQREESSTAMDDVVDRVLGTKTGGPMKIPLWRRGRSRG